MEVENFKRYKFYRDGRVYCKSHGDFLKGSIDKNKDRYFNLQNDFSKKTLLIKKSAIIKMCNYYTK